LTTSFVKECCCYCCWWRFECLL